MIIMIFSGHDIKFSEMPVREAIFEVQVLLALERAAAPHGVELRVPRCISYKARDARGERNFWRTLGYLT